MIMWYYDMYRPISSRNSWAARQTINAINFHGNVVLSRIASRIAKTFDPVSLVSMQCGRRKIVVEIVVEKISNWSVVRFVVNTFEMDQFTYIVPHMIRTLLCEAFVSQLKNWFLSYSKCKRFFLQFSPALCNSQIYEIAMVLCRRILTAHTYTITGSHFRVNASKINRRRKRRNETRFSLFLSFLLHFHSDKFSSSHTPTAGSPSRLLPLTPRCRRVASTLNFNRFRLIVDRWVALFRFYFRSSEIHLIWFQLGNKGRLKRK